MIALLLAFVGCQNEELVNENTNNGGEKVILTANIQGAADSRVVLSDKDGSNNSLLDENGNPIVKVAWNERGETFEVYGSSGACSTFIQIANTNQFEGTLPATATGEYEAYYGNPNSLVEQDGKLGQSTANDSPVLMGATFDSSSPSITFEHVTAILKPTFKVNGTDIDNSITKIVMSNVAKPTPESSANAFNRETITITPTSSATVLDDNIYIHLFVFSQLYVEGYEFTFTVTDKDNKEYTGSLTIPKDMSIEAGNLYTATIDLIPYPYLTFTVGGEQSLVLNVAGTLNSTIQYSADGGAWTNFVMNGTDATIPVLFTNNLRMRGKSASGTFEVDSDTENINGFMISFADNNTPVTCSGDIRTLVDYTSYETTSTATACFYGLFINCLALADASELKLISNNNKMAESCYESMFLVCESLKSAPALPATTLAASCYKGMFMGCTSLTTAPELPAEELAVFCYVDMFRSCKSLTSAPELPATTLAPSCYVEMFAGCSNLTTAPAQLPAPTLADNCYSNMFVNCSKLVSAPVLPAETLVTGCYWHMFQNCTSLKSVTMLATDITADGCLTDWLEGVAATGTFTKAASMTTLPEGASGIPSGWTVENQ